MAELSVTQWNNVAQTIECVDWEEQSYREGCAYAREQAKRRLQTLDDELLGCKPKGLNVEGFRNRTVVTRFGEVVVRGRMYSDGDGNTISALDDYLGWKPRQQASPSLTESIVSMASAVPPYQVRGRLFRMANKMVSDLTAGVLSPMTVHRLLSGVGQSAMDEEHNRWESCFEHGEDVCDGQQQADVLYTEADGVWVHLQREDRKHYEVKSGIAYRGWRSVGDDRYELVDKRVYAHASEEIPFWEGAGIEWGKQYALDGVKLFVVGGDGANWIRRGVEEFGCAVFQLNRNGELSEFCRSRRRSDRGETDPAPAQHREVVSKTRVSDWVEMSVPALSGPHNSRPWAHSLRNLVQPPHRLNWYRLGFRVTGFELFVDKEVEVKEVGIRNSVLSR